MRKKSLETSNMKQPKIETEKNIEFLKEAVDALIQKYLLIIRKILRMQCFHILISICLSKQMILIFTKLMKWTIILSL